MTCWAGQAVGKDEVGSDLLWGMGLPGGIVLVHGLARVLPAVLPCTVVRVLACVLGHMGDDKVSCGLPAYLASRSLAFTDDVAGDSC